MKAIPGPRWILPLLALLPITIAGHACAQYMYLDMDGDGVHTAADVLSPGGTTACDIWIRTDANEDGSPAICATGCEALNMTDPEFILRASGGSVTWGSYTGYAPFPASAITDHNVTDFYARLSVSTAMPPAAYRLGVLLVTANSGTPTLDFVPSTTLSGVYLTGFGSGCYGQEYDNTYKLGVDWGMPQSVWHIQGHVFSDDNASGSCTPDPGEPAMANVLLTVKPGNKTLLTDPNGDYDLCGGIGGEYTITATPPAGYEQSCPWFLQPWTITIQPSQLATGINFGMKPPLSTITGHVFSDLNASGTCTPDAGEPMVSGRSVSISPSAPGGSTTATGAYGYYRFGDLPSGTYTLTYLPYPGWSASCPGAGGSRTLFVGVQSTVSDIDFATKTNATSYDLSAVVEGGLARPGANKTYGIRVRNDGQTVAGVNALFTLPAETPYVSSSSPGIYDGPSNSVSFALGTLLAGQEVWLKVVVSVPAFLTLGTQLAASASVTPTAADVKPADNAMVEYEPVRNSYDPNEKLVQPSGRIVRSQTLAYHIGFQNVGTAPALLVVVRDTLDANLDPATVVSGGSSHPYGFSQSGRVLTWTFDEINLPDSTSSEADSHGFVGFRAAPLAGAPDGAEIRNTASIYFDKNPPVVTGETYNLIDSPPVLASIPDRTAIEGATKDQGLSAADPQSDPLTFTLVSGPGWATVTTSTPTSGNLHLAPQAGDAGSATVIVQVSDGLLSDLDTCTVNVLTPTGVAETELFRAQQIRLNTSAETTCIRIAPGSQAFAAADVDAASVVLSASREGTAVRAAATGAGDGGNVCFRSGDLRALLSATAPGPSPGSVWCEGRLTSGPSFAGLLPISVILPPGALAASITPNPLHAGSVLTFRTQRTGSVRAAIFSAGGRRVRTLLSSPRMLPGYQAIPIDGRDDHGRPLASGVYFYRIDAAEGTQTGRFTVLR